MSGTPVGITVMGARTLRAQGVSDGAGGRDHEVGAVGEATGQPHGEGGDQPLRQRHVVRVLLVACGT